MPRFKALYTIVPGLTGHQRSSLTVPLLKSIIPINHRDLYKYRVRNAEESITLRPKFRLNNSAEPGMTVCRYRLACATQEK
jgi:hypothetical protein